MKRTVILILVIIVLLLAGAFGFLAIRMGWISIKSQNAVPKEYTYLLGDFTVNLNEPGYKRYMKVKIYAGYSNKKLEQALADNTPAISDAIAGVLRSKKIDDVNTPEKTDAVKGEIKEKINGLLTEQKLTKIYFSEIIIQ